jgi:hypothetical protein
MPKIRAEVFFLKYAFPCAFITLQRGKITKREYDFLWKCAVKGKPVSRETLERVFAAASRRIREMSLRKKMQPWSLEALREYYWRRHNEIIDKRLESYKFAPLVLRELCKVMPARVLMLKRKVAVVKFEGSGKTRAVMTDLVGKLKKGDRVMVHYGYAVERL